MAAEIPALSAVVARLPNPVVNLAAYGGIVFPLALIIESPIIMLLAASTTLCKEWDSYVKIRRYMMIAGALLTLLHVMVVMTPLYYVIVEDLLGAPEAIQGPARVGLLIMTPWTWSIAYRRFHQGVLIRFGHSRTVGIGTAVRLAADGLVLAIGYAIGSVPGIVVATSAVAAGVVSEAVFVGWRVRPVVRGELRRAPPSDPPLTYRAFARFYVPLVLTALLSLLAQPIGSAALGRMPDPLVSLAVWPVVSGLVFIVRGAGIAYNEVVVALLDQQGSTAPLRRFAVLLGLCTTAILTLLVATPASAFWFGRFSALPAPLAAMARSALWLALPVPALSVMQSWFQGAILHGRRTRGITEAVVAYLVTMVGLLMAGVIRGQVSGLYVAMAAIAISMAVQTAWLWWRSRPAVAAVASRDAVEQGAVSYG